MDATFRVRELFGYSHVELSRAGIYASDYAPSSSDGHGAPPLDSIRSPDGELLFLANDLAHTIFPRFLPGDDALV